MLLSLLACTPRPPDGPGLIGDHPLNPFPVDHLHAPEGRLDLDPSWFDLPAELTPLSTGRLAWRDGFSPAQTVVVRLDRVEPDALPSWRDPRPGETGVRLLDRTSGRWLPVMAELDAHERAQPGTLLIRPLEALPPGHTIAVALTTALTDPVPRFRAALTRRPPRDLVDQAEHYASLAAAFAERGLPTDELALAWSFSVGDGTAPLRSAWEQVPVPVSYTLGPPLEADHGDPVPPATWRAAAGSFTTPDFLVDDLALNLQPDGSVLPTGTVEAPIHIHVPTSVADAAPRSVPVLIFGHGILSLPEHYLDDPADPSRVAELAHRLGAIVIATRWRGLTTPDLPTTLQVASDFGQFHTLTDRLVQAQANLKALIRLIHEGELLDDPLFLGRDGQPLPDRDRLLYYGISLGAIEGAVALADAPPFEHTVLHVGGSQWSTMLERSSNWPPFALLVERSIPDALTRQRLYALSQLWWDPVDPIAYVEDLYAWDLLLQEARGDQQVPNLTTRVLARSIGLPLLEPAVEPVWGINTAPGPLPRAFVQADPERGLPPEGNLPAPDSGAHEAPRLFDGIFEQTLGMLATGQIEHRCGHTPCSASNPGD